MDFSDALIHLKTGAQIARRHWNGKVIRRGIGIDGQRIFFSAKSGDEGIWIPCVADLLAEDWCVVAESEVVSLPLRVRAGPNINGVHKVIIVE